MTDSDTPSVVGQRVSGLHEVKLDPETWVFSINTTVVLSFPSHLLAHLFLHHVTRFAACHYSAPLKPIIRATVEWVHSTHSEWT